MPVDRAMRDVVVRDLAALMRGEMTPKQFMKDTQAQCEQPPPPNDFLVESFWDNRLGPLSADLAQLDRLRTSQRGYEHLRRWLAILQTDVDWNVERELQKHGCLMACLPPVLTILTMIAVGLLLDGVLIIPWVLIGLVVGPIGLFMAMRQSNELPIYRDPNPFASTQDRDSVMHLADALDVPRYDREKHGASIGDRIRLFLPLIPIAILLCIFMIATWPLVILAWWRGDDDVIERVPLPTRET